MKEIHERIATILRETFEVRRDDIDSAATFADLGLDSLAVVELALILDNEFGTALGDDELTDTMTPGDVVRLISVKSTVA